MSFTESGNLWAHTLTPEQHEHSCGYWYTVETSYATAHTAFATRAGLDRWLGERNLKLERELPERGVPGTTRIIGVYRRRSHFDLDEFAAVRPVVVTAEMDNGSYTLGLIDEDEHGVRTVHHLNCNVPSRLVFDHKRTREQMS